MERCLLSGVHVQLHWLVDGCCWMMVLVRYLWLLLTYRGRGWYISEIAVTLDLCWDIVYIVSIRSSAYIQVVSFRPSRQT